MPARPVLVSIFNDVLGPVMRGPSSSHCAAALRIGRLARDLTEGRFEHVLVEFDRAGSLATTHESQGSDMGLCGGLLGWEATDARLPGSVAALKTAGVEFVVRTTDAHDPHPNTYRLTLRQGDDVCRLVATSTGGGMIEVIEIDDFKVCLLGDFHETLIFVAGDVERYAQALKERVVSGELRFIQSPRASLVHLQTSHPVADEALVPPSPSAKVLQLRRVRPVLPIPSRQGMRVPFHDCESMLRHASGRDSPLWKLAVEYEMARGNLTEDEVLARTKEILGTLRNALEEGLSGTEYDDRILGRQSEGFRREWEAGRLIDGGILNRAILYVTAIMEVKSAMGVIVAAPTAGACAALPGVVMAAGESLGASEDAVIKAMLAAGVIGVFIATRWTFAAEVGGCQAEGGAASAMAAAGLVSLAEGDLSQAVAAASMALQNMLGLICDPVANRVEVPCLGKNVLAAGNALSAANMALAGFDPVIPLDEVIETATRVGRQMPRELRCTALGGLSTTATSRKIEQELKAKAARCGTGGECC